MSGKYQCRPSDLLGLDSPLFAYYLDRAVWVFGSRVEAELDKARDSSKSKNRQAMAVAMVQQRWLGISGFAKGSRKRKR